MVTVLYTGVDKKIQNAIRYYSLHLCKKTKVLEFGKITSTSETEYIEDNSPTNQSSRLNSKEVETIHHLLPQVSNINIDYKKKSLTIDSKRVNETPKGCTCSRIYPEFYLEISIRCKGGIDTIKEFEHDALSYYDNIIRNMKKVNDKISIYMYKDYWDLMSKRTKRKEQTTYLPGDTFEKIKDKVFKFNKHETISMYSKLNIHHKLMILFDGPPGTGKTTTIFAIASILDMDIGIINFDKDMDDATLANALKSIPDNCMIIIEDIDTIFCERKKNDEHKNAISFSGILNAMDGLMCPEHLIGFITTNHINRLDPALIRAGRIDIRIEFDYAKKDQIQAMFNKFIPNQEKNFKEFYNHIKKSKITPAILQEFFFQNIYIEESDNICNNITNLLKMITNDKSIKEDNAMYA